MQTAADRWRLESFIEALIFELDKAQDTLSVKGINRKLTYTVRDVAVDLNVFPDYTRDELVFSVAKPGDSGSSRISFQLGSITDKQILETTSGPVEESDFTIDEVEEIEPEVKARLKRIGVKSARDLDRIGRRNVALPALVGRVEDGAAKEEVSYRKLADMISKARRSKSQPAVRSAAIVAATPQALVLRLEGDNLFDPAGPTSGPLGVLHGRDLAVRRAGDAIEAEIPHGLLRRGANLVSIAPDPTAVFHIDLARRSGE